MLIFRYLAKEIILVTLAALIIFLLVFVSTQVVIYLNKMASGQLDPQLLLQIVGIISATLVGMLLPMAFFLGIVLTYGRLYAESEMTALYACGMSRKRLAFYTLIIAVPITMIVSYLSFIAMPQLAAYQNKLIINAAEQNIIQSLAPGRFRQFENGMRIFYIESVSRDRKKLQNIFIAERGVQTNPLKGKTDHPTSASQKEEWDIILAKSGEQRVELEKGGKFLVINEGFRYVGEAGEKKILQIQFGSYGIRLPEITEVKNNPKNRSWVPTSQLWRDYSKDIKSAIELQWRISIPLQTLILALLAVPLSRTAPRQGRYAPLFATSFIYLIYANSLFIGRDWIQKGVVNIHIGLWGIHVLLLLLTIYLYVGRPGWNPVGKIISISNLLRKRK